MGFSYDFLYRKSVVDLDFFFGTRYPGIDINEVYISVTSSRPRDTAELLGGVAFTALEI